MKDSKDYFIARIVTNEEMQCNGYIDFLLRNMKEQISNGILDIVSDGNEYAIKMLPEQRIKQTDMMSIEIRQGISIKELVRCRECKHAHLTHDGDIKYCDLLAVKDEYGECDPCFYRSGDWFCADGERKDGAE